MSLSEFALIEKYFQRSNQYRHVHLGIGDDCALVDVPSGYAQALSMDTLVAGVHFPTDTDACDVGYKSLAVNLSDLAAMGATPSWFSQALTLPAVNEQWLSRFRDGLFELADQFNLPLIGGDVTKGPLSITIQIAGIVKASDALKRSGAQVGDCIYVSGTLGDAAAGLLLKLNSSRIQSSKSAAPPSDARLCDEYNAFLTRLNRPTPRIGLGQALLGVATSCIDLSDGLLADLSHICAKSRVGAELHFDSLPVSPTLNKLFVERCIDVSTQLSIVAASGDDYELCFTAPKRAAEALQAISDTLQLPITLIGKITSGESVECLNKHGQLMNHEIAGFRHF